ncbi:peptide chain release factor N(5)-glutamine methyltransferase [Candidatus Tachikawaea gelatinosa]|uniref:Release factor glutamine methyltransferase n=1 Tax=Candidatus Tachikawaea gelatinosa TaxID=1410383 RepID=A0A090AJJ0_9ENTR|nr:peptide chain release factor N(5)-glutamine methyltransferase [Candidatus Tachikawaea gelatinosa]BAP58613.1 release factor glutamine methyltransferase [Candidatus Tachikawaea gelatinosa]
MKIYIWLKNAIKFLKNVENPKCEALYLLSQVTGKKYSWLTVFDDKILTNKQIKNLNYLLKKRIKGIPLQYILKKWDFWSLTLHMNNKVFIPRQDTEILVENTLNNIPKKPSSILDLGTGSGAIALAIAHERPDCKIFGIDCSKYSIMLARKNAYTLNIKNVFFFLSNWFSNVPYMLFDVIISNPPYIDKNDLFFKKNNFEPLHALISKNNGFQDLFFIIQESKKWLKSHGLLFLEHGFQQGKKINSFIRKQGFTNVQTIKDYNQLPRVTFGKFFNIK